MKGWYLKVTILIIFSYFFQIRHGLAQSNYSLVSYSTEHGLAHSSVSKITKDRHGIMWMATWNGLHRFDGTSFRTFKKTTDRKSYLESRRMVRIAEGLGDKLWVLTYDKQLYWFDKKAEVFHPLSPEIDKRAKKRVLFDRILYVDGDNVWLRSENDGLYVISDKDPSLQRIVFPGISEPENIIVNSFLKDRNGIIWLGTNSGLYTLQQRSGKFIVGSISEELPKAASISRIVENESGLYCIVNEKSIFYLNKKTKAAKKIWSSEGSINHLSGSRKNQRLFCTTEGGELCLLDSGGSGGRIIHKASNSLYGLFEDSKGILWIELRNGGVLRFNSITGDHSTIKSPFYHANSNMRFEGFEDPNHTVWIGMNGGGFGYFDEEKQQFNFSIHDMNKKDIVLPQHISNLFYDPDGIAWFSTEKRGLVKLVIGNDSFKHTSLKQSSRSTWGEEVRSIVFDRQGRSWSGTKGGDLVVRKRNLVQPVNFRNMPSNGLGPIYSLLEDREGNIWIGTKGKGLYKAVPGSQKKDSYTLSHFNKTNSGLFGEEVYSIYQDKDQQIWLGTFDAGLFKLNESSDKITFSSVALGGNQSDKIRHITSDRDGNLWIASIDGLIIYDRIGKTRLIRDHEDIKSRIGDNDIQYLHLGSGGEMWVCTAGGGITRVRGNAFGKLQMQNFSTEQGLVNDFVLSCVEDRQRSLWVTTKGGLSRLDLKSNKFVNVDVNEGFKALGFAEKAIAYNAACEIIWGTSVGALSLDLGKLHPKSSQSQIVFSSFAVNNQEWGKGNLSGDKFINIQYLDEVNLLHNQNNLTFDFSVTDHRYSHHNFSYRLIGLDSTWKQNGSLQRASFTNLDPGVYYLEIKCESDLYSDRTFRRLKLVISPPWWHTSWAYLAYALLVVLFVVLVRRFLLTILHLKNKVILEQKLSEVKMEFFTNISHELRTPLTLILSPATKLLSSNSLTSEERNYAGMIRSNAKVLERFVNQLLDVRRLKEKKFELRLSRFDFSEWLNDIAETFRPSAEEAAISLAVRCDEPCLNVVADKEKMEIIIRNLLSNALKYAPPHSSIEIYLRRTEDGKDIMVDVRDQGPGVPEKSCDKIFDLFYVVYSADKTSVGSTGVGLSLVRELVNLHGGHVSASNNAEGGLCVSFSFPYMEEADEHYVVSDADAETADIASGGSLSALREDPVPELQAQEKQKVLIVEDNKELRWFLSLELRSHYQVYLANDGVEGMEMATSVLPDLIISDVMMPNLDGIQFLDLVRKNQDTSHIPFILLTARHAIESQIEGLKYGADAYITKPFDTEFLLVSVKNLLVQRRRLFEQMKSGVADIWRPQEVVMTNKDESFLLDVIRIVDEGLENSELSVDDLAIKMSMGRNTFYRKFKSLTNLTPVEFLRDRRLDKAKVYLENGTDNIAEVAYLVGFNDPKYFSKCFKSRFGSNPKEFAQSLSSNQLS
ncbi:two component regulator with propeller domain [Arcticibacter pallidicorallinus]|uniref:histidine kinase n=1 Tax=Arcticibacter pallidicorallinus TaxID=1259464 RepID=A0A2T0U5M8_9SPHI|nr:hybrid sensor histidine kinase/response regulator transcription factor [Arcticibacter pallidicorallinus]PRY53226.1 two component regulator with propeller domain [Arcticibacter pallidicorallinus]